MDALLTALAKLLGTFIEPTQVVLLFVVAGLSFVCWKFARFFMDTYERSIASDIKMTSALEGLAEAVKEKMK